MNDDLLTAVSRLRAIVRRLDNVRVLIRENERMKNNEQRLALWQSIAYEHGARESGPDGLKRLFEQREAERQHLFVERRAAENRRDSLYEDRMKVESERDAARANHLKVMQERDAALALVQKFCDQHEGMVLHGRASCTECQEAEKLLKIE